VPAFHSTTCDQVHSPGWDADAGSSLVPVQAQQAQASPSASASAAHHAGAAARWLFGPVLDPRSKRVQRWNRWILLGRAAALAVDPLFFYALSIGRAGQPCLYMDAGLAAAVTALRTFADVAHLGHVLLQFRLAYVSRESLVVGCGKLVWDARAIAAHYARSLKGLWFDLFVILPLPQVSCWHPTASPELNLPFFTLKRIANTIQRCSCCGDEGPEASNAPKLWTCSCLVLRQRTTPFSPCRDCRSRAHENIASQQCPVVS
jgi:hypothetical protein